MAPKAVMIKGLSQAAGFGRNGDSILVHMSPEEAAAGAHAQGGWSINPHTGLPEFFSFGGLLKSVAKAAGAIVGGYFGGPAGAALGAGAATKLTGGSWNSALATGLASGIGAYGLQSSGLTGNWGGGFNSGAGLLGQSAGTGLATAGNDTVASHMLGGGSGSSGGGFSLSKMLPLAAVAAAAVGGSGSVPKTQTTSTGAAGSGAPVGPDWSKYQPMDRTATPYSGDYLTYGQHPGGEHQFYDEVNPAPVISKKAGGKIRSIRHFKYGGDTHEGGATGGGSGAGSAGHDSGGGKGGGFSDARHDAGLDSADHYGGGNAAGQGGSDSAGASISRKIRNGDPTQIADDMRQGVAAANIDPHQSVGYASGHAPSGLQNGIANAIESLGLGHYNPNAIAHATAGSYDPSRTTASDAGSIDPIGLGLRAAGLFSPIGDVASIGYGLANRMGVYGPQIGIGDFGPEGTTASSGLAGQGSDGKGGLATSGGNPAAPASSANQAATAAPSAQPGNAASTAGRQYLGYNGDYLTYGQHPENQFWTPMVYAGGGSVDGVQSGIGGYQGPVSGPGGGQDDLIPAQLADGEHVVDSDTVAALGDGSNAEGHRKLEAFKANIRQQKRSAPTNKIPPKTRALSSYMKSRAA